jgi:hypothetical protein
MKFKKGDKVKYVSGKHGDYSGNPLWGGNCGCVAGIFMGDIGTGDYYDVIWDNGEQNCYRLEDLELVEKINKSHPLTKIFL